MKIDLGGEIRKTCAVCGMNYIPSNSEDAALHKRFHGSNVGGVDLPKAFLSYVGTNYVWSGEGGSCIVALNRRDSLAARNVARRVLNVVNAELSAVDIEDDKLWSQIDVPDKQRTDSSADSSAAKRGPIKTSTCDRFKVYLYIHGCKCVGLCLAERISRAAKVVNGTESGITRPAAGAPTSSSIAVAEDMDPAVLGISRIWTSRSHRGNGIARSLLDCAADSFLYGLRIEKDLVAFSQTTESGGRLARCWFGMEYGWRVYVD